MVVREPARETTFRVVVVVVVALLLLNFGIIVYFVHPAFNPDDDDGDVKEPEPEGDWLVPEEPVELVEDTNWEGLDTFLEAPIVVTTGNDLVIRDCHIRVHLEDLLFWLRPAFEVEPGASLLIDNSTLEVHQDPRLESAVVGAYIRPDHNIPYIARVVNLDRVADPVFHMDVQWLGNVTPLAVGVVPAGGDELVLLETFAPDAFAPHSWMHKEVGLSDYAGTRPWLVVWFHSFPEAPLLVGNLSIMDGDGWTPGDAFPTGHPVKDGWLISRFMDIPTLQRIDDTRGYWEILERCWQPLIDARGDVIITGSQVVEPTGMGRKASGDLRKESIGPEPAPHFDQVGARGGHISIVEATLTLESSELVNVPVTGLNATLRARSSTFTGDHDLVSLHRPTGYVRDCTLVNDPRTPANPFGSDTRRNLWALGVEGTSLDDPLEVEDSTFSGNQVSIDLSHADVRLAGNTFTHISGLAIWDHASNGAAWEDLDGANTFEDMDEKVFLSSSVTDVEFVHPDNETDEIAVYTNSPIQTWLDLSGTYSTNLQSVHGNKIRYVVPRMLVKASGEVQRSRTVLANVNWPHGSGTFSFSPSDTDLIIDLSQLPSVGTGEDLPYQLRLVEVSTGTSPGAIGLSVRMDDAWSMTHADPTMLFHADEAEVASVPLTGDQFINDEDLVATTNLTLLPGWRELHVTVWGREPLDGGGYAEEPTLLARLSHSLLVLAETNDIEPWMPLTADYLIVPGNATIQVDLGEPPEPPERQFHSVRVLGSNGSRLVMDGSALEGRASTKFYLHENVSLHLENARFTYLEVSEERWNDEGDWRGAPISLTNVSAGTLGVDGLGRDIDLADLRISEYLGIGTGANSNVTVRGCRVENAYAHVGMWNGRLLIEDCTFSSNWSDFLYLEPLNANVTVRDCTFSGAGLLVFFDNWYQQPADNVTVTGNTFTGDDAILYLGWNLLRVDSYDVDPDFVPDINGTIEGNAFSGAGPAVVLHHGLFGQVWGDNDLDDDTRLYAFYITRLQVIPPDGTPFWGAYDFVPTPGMVSDWPFGTFRWFEMDGELLYDVTDDTSKETDPPTLDVVLYALGSYRYVRGFSQVVPNADNDEATYPVLPDFPELLKDHLVHWPPLEDQA